MPWYTQRESNPYLHLERVPTLPFSRWAHINAALTDGSFPECRRVFIYRSTLMALVCGSMVVAFPWLVVSGCCIAKILCAHSTAVVSAPAGLAWGFKQATINHRQSQVSKPSSRLFSAQQLPNTVRPATPTRR